MLAVKGVYDKGRIYFKENVKTSRPVSVIITFLEEHVEVSEKNLIWKNFHSEKPVNC